MRIFSPQPVLWKTTTYPQAVAPSCVRKFFPQKKNAHSTSPVHKFFAPDCPPARSALGSTSGGAGSPNGLTEGVSCVFCSVPIFRSAPPQLRIRSAAFNSGMIATGNHNFERFAALCNTPEGAPRALRAIKFPRFLSCPVTGRVRALPYWYTVRSVIVRRHCRRIIKKIDENGKSGYTKIKL